VNTRNDGKLFPEKKCGGPHCAGTARIGLANDPVAPMRPARGSWVSICLIFHMPNKVGRFFGNMDQNLITMLAEGIPYTYIEPFRVLYETWESGCSPNAW
jgi:hypothetical protein